MTRIPLADLRKPTAIRTAAVTMGLLTITGAVAPAALAAEDTAAATPTTPATQDEESTPAAPVLTPSPTPTTPAVTPPAVTPPAAGTPAAGTPAAGTPAASTPPASTPAAGTPATPVPPVAAAAAPYGAHYGTGKQAIVLAGEGASVPAGESIDPTGAQVRMEFSKQNGVPAPAAATCTFEQLEDLGTSCMFGVTPPAFPDYGPFGIDLPPNSEFTLTLVRQPDSGQLLRLAGSPASLKGHTTGLGSTPEPADPLVPGPIVLSAPGGYRTLGVSLGGDGARAGATFELCTVRGSDCTGDGDEGEPIGGPIGLPIGWPFGPGGLPILLADAQPANTPTFVVSTTTDAQGRATFPGTYRPGAYTVVQTSAPAGQSFDPAPQVLTVGVATSLADRATPVLLPVGDQQVDPPVTVPVDTPSTPAPTAPTVNEVAEQSLAAGKEQTISIGGFQPFEMVHGVLHSTPVDLGTVQADANGVATFTFTVPAGLETGTHSVTMEGLTSGIVGTATFTVTAAAAAETTGGLAYTGADVVPLIALGGGLLAVGAGAVTVANRRRSA